MGKKLFPSVKLTISIGSDVVSLFYHVQTPMDTSMVELSVF